MSGNPVRIGDGCATVKGYKLPKPLVSSETGKAGVRFQARSQDIDLAVLVAAFAAGQARRLACKRANFSVKEKDEASLSRVCVAGFADCLHSPFCRGLEVFFGFRPRAGLSTVNPLRGPCGAIERSALEEEIVCNPGYGRFVCRSA